MENSLYNEKQKKQNESYKKIKTIGKGSFGEVFLVECKSDKQLAVIKQVDISEVSDEERKQIVKEGMIL